MRDFFKDWKRKAGVVTLGLALLLTGAWVRSYHTKDIFQRRVSKNSVYFLVSNRSWLYWQCVRESRPSQIALLAALSQETPSNYTQPLITLNSFHFGRAADDANSFDSLTTEQGTFALPNSNTLLNSGVKLDVWSVPYWCIVLPLTLLSAWLLLNRPRPAKPKSS